MEWGWRGEKGVESVIMLCRNILIQTTQERRAQEKILVFISPMSALKDDDAASCGAPL